MIEDRSDRVQNGFASPAGPDVTADAAADGSGFSKLKVAIADDRSSDLDRATAAVEAAGYEVVVRCSSGDAFSFACQEAEVDVALLDICMPDVDGIRLSVELIEEQRVPSVIMSAQFDPVYLEHAQEAGVFGYLTKPVQASQVQVSLYLAHRHFQLWKPGEDIQGSVDARRRARRIIRDAVRLISDSEKCGIEEAHERLEHYARESCDTKREAAEYVAGYLDKAAARARRAGEA
ncbi:MAG: response regulator [Planctomycetota bacterium]